MNRDRPSRAQHDDEDDKKPRRPAECPWCGASKKRPRRPMANGTCNKHCEDMFVLYQARYEPEVIGRGKRR